MNKAQRITLSIFVPLVLAIAPFMIDTRVTTLYLDGRLPTSSGVYLAHQPWAWFIVAVVAGVFVLWLWRPARS